jgi:RimJ/RimL family protein N-acetyltransferase
VGTNFWQGSRVRLRAVEPEDWENWYRYSLDTDTVRCEDRVRFPQSKEALRELVKKLSTKEREGDEYNFVIETLSGEYIGEIDTFDCDRRFGTFKYAIGVLKEFRRQGYAAEAMPMVLRFYFKELRYQKATVTVYDFNAPSIKLQEKLGFAPEGRLRRMYYTNGRYHDLLYFGMTADEFAARYDQKR